jgi:hypothetical protein
MLDQLFLSNGSITDVDIEQNFENMRKVWDPQKPVETLFKQIQDCVDFSEAGGVTIGATQKLSSAYSKIFESGKFNSARRRWDENLAAEKTWENSKSTLGLHIVSTKKCSEKFWEPKDMQMLLFPKLKMI